MNSGRLEHRRVACLNADISGYSRLIADDVEETVRTLGTFLATLAAFIAKQGGTVVDVVGDNLLAEFDTVACAVRCGVEMQRELEVRNAGLPTRRQFRFRIGIELGDVLRCRGRLYGNCVNIAARVQQIANPGSVCLAGAAYDEVDRTGSLRFEDLGEHAVKNIDRPLRIYRVNL
jgi:adenylate cyclase